MTRVFVLTRILVPFAEKRAFESCATCYRVYGRAACAPRAGTVSFEDKLWCYGSMGYMTEQVDAHNEVTLITFCKDHLKEVTVPFEDKLPYNKHKPYLFLLLFTPFSPLFFPPFFLF